MGNRGTDLPGLLIRGSALEHTGVKLEGCSLADADLLESRVERVEEVVQVRGDDSRRDSKNRCLSSTDPSGPKVGQRLGCRIASPVGGQLSRSDPGYWEGCRNIRRNRDEIVRGFGGVKMDEQFERGKGERRRGVNDGCSREIPSAAGQSRALAVERGVFRLGYAPDSNQL